jgi:hypothetical protein
MSSEAAVWRRFLRFWTLLVIVMFLGLVAISIAGGPPITSAADRQQLESMRLMEAVRAPITVHLLQTLEAAAWLGFTVTVLVLARILTPQAPVRATLAAACTIGLPLTGPLARLLHRNGVAELAPRYAAAAPDQQAAVLQAYLDLSLLVRTHLQVGLFLAGTAFVLVGWAALSRAALPRWVAGWLVMTGLVTLTRFVAGELGLPWSASGTFLLVNNILGIGGAHVLLAITLWRAPASQPAGHAPPQPAG